MPTYFSDTSLEQYISICANVAVFLLPIFFKERLWIDKNIVHHSICYTSYIHICMWGNGNQETEKLKRKAETEMLKLKSWNWKDETLSKVESGRG